MWAVRSERCVLLADEDAGEWWNWKTEAENYVIYVPIFTCLTSQCPQPKPDKINIQLRIVSASSKGNALHVLVSVILSGHLGEIFGTDSVFLLTRNAMLRMPLRHLRSMSLRWGKCTGRTGKLCRGSRPETSCLVTSWRLLVGWPALDLVHI